MPCQLCYSSIPLCYPLVQNTFLLSIENTHYASFPSALSNLFHRSNLTIFSCYRHGSTIWQSSACTAVFRVWHLPFVILYLWQCPQYIHTTHRQIHLGSVNICLLFCLHLSCPAIRSQVLARHYKSSKQDQGLHWNQGGFEWLSKTYTLKKQTS